MKKKSNLLLRKIKVVSAMTKFCLHAFVRKEASTTRNAVY